ncbi:MAG: serine/threonine protein kinase [Archangiaceae bacterium]|nr:serine/threonine protein kinase [Archangiaceae bacterium]
MRLVGVFVAIALMAAGFFIGRKLEGDAASLNSRAAKDRAERSAGEAVAALEKQLAIFQLKAQGAASNPSLQALVRGGVDEATVHDTLSTEEWAVTYRERAATVAVYAGAQKLGGTVSMLDDQTLAAAARSAQESGEAQSLVAHQGLYFLGAAKLPFASGDGRKVAVVLARPLGQDELDALGTPALLITDGKTRLATRGDAAALAALPGREREGEVGVGNAVAAVRALGPFWVWALAPVGAEVAPPVQPAVIWAVSSVLALGALGLSFLAGKKKPIPLDQAVTDPNLLNATGVSNRGASPSQVGFAQTSPSMPAGQGSSRYQEIAPLGEGGMAKVSLAVTHGAEGFRRTFVVKRLKAELTGTPELVNQFIDEARLGASLVHSNIVPVFDFGRDAEGYFMAQEYIMGRDLDAVRQALFEVHRATLDLPLVLYVAQEALKALSYAHGKTDDEGRPMGLVHRDVSPNNLMVSARGEVKLLDFGIVKAEGKLSHTQTGMIKGNVFFMSPEQARGQPVDRRSDLFSLGLVLFSVAAGETLYRGNSNYDLLTRAAEGLSQPEWDRVGRLPEVLRGLLGRVLQRDPDKRFSSADEFAHAIPPGQVGSAVAMQQLMEALFKDDFTRERTRFSTSGQTGAFR